MDGQVEAAEWVFLPQALLLGRTADWVGLESPASRRGHVVGKTCPDCSATRHLNLLLPLFLRLDFLGGISKHLTTNLQDSGIPPPPQVPSSSLCFLFHNPRKPEQPQGLTQLSSLPHVQAPPSLFCLLGLPHFPGPNCLLPQIFRFLGQAGLGSGCGGQNPGWQSVWP